jgi:hypothetical protein
MADKRQSTQVVPKHEHHGNSVAAWTAVTIMLVGFLLAVFAWVKHNDLVLYGAGAGVIVVGLIVGKVLQMMGLGVKND